MKKLIAMLAITATLTACGADGKLNEDAAGGLVFGAVAVAICAQSGVCAFPI